MVSQVVATDQCLFLILPLLLLIASVLVTIGSVRSCLGMPLMRQWMVSWGISFQTWMSASVSICGPICLSWIQVYQM